MGSIPTLSLSFWVYYFPGKDSAIAPGSPLNVIVFSQDAGVYSDNMPHNTIAHETFDQPWPYSPKTGKPGQ